MLNRVREEVQEAMGKPSPLMLCFKSHAPPEFARAKEPHLVWNV